MGAGNYGAIQAGDAFVSIFADLGPLQAGLNQAGRLLQQRGQAIARAGQSLFQGGTFTNQMRGVRDLVAVNAQLRNQYEGLLSLSPKLATLAAPFFALKGASSGLRTMFDPGKMARDAQAGFKAAAGAAEKQKLDLLPKIGMTPEQYAKYLSPYGNAIKAAQESLSKVAISPGSKTLRGFAVTENLKSANADLMNAAAGSAVLPAATKWTESTEKLAQVQKLREEISERKELVRLSQASLKTYDANAAKSQLGDLSRRKVLLSDVHSEEMKLTGAQGRMSALTGKAGVGGTITAIKSEIEKSAKELSTAQERADAALASGGKSMSPYIAAVKAAEQEVAKFGQALAKAEVAEKNLTDAQLRFKHAADTMRGKVGAGMISESEYKKQMAPYEHAVHAAEEQAKNASKVPKWDIALGGALSTVVNLGSAFLSVGKIVMSVGSAIFSVFSGVVSVVTSIASTIVSALGSAFEFLKNAASSAFKYISMAVLAIGGAVVAGLRSAFAKGNELINAFANTGIKVGQSALLQRAAEMAGMESSAIETEVNRMQRALSAVDDVQQKMKARSGGRGSLKDVLDPHQKSGGSSESDPEPLKTQHAIKALGLSIESLRAMQPTQQLQAIAGALQKIPDPADRAAAAIDIFSVRGHEMIGFLMQLNQLGPLAAQQWGKAASVLEQFAPRFAFIERSLGGLKTKWQAFFIGLGSEVSGPLSALAAQLNNFDPTGLGQKIGKRLKEGIDTFINAWNTGKVGELVSNSLKFAFATAGNYLIALFSGISNGLAAVFKIDGLFPALGDGIAGAFKFGLGVFLETFHAILPDIAEGLGKALGLVWAAVKNYPMNNTDQKAITQRDEDIADHTAKRTELLSKQLSSGDYKHDTDMVHAGLMSADEKAKKFQAGSYLSGWDKGGVDIENDAIKQAEREKAEFQKNIDDRNKSSADEAAEQGKAFRSTAAGWVAPENTGKLKSEGSALLKSSGTALSTMLPNAAGALVDAVKASMGNVKDVLGSGASGSALAATVKTVNERDKTPAERAADQKSVQQAEKRLSGLKDQPLATANTKLLADFIFDKNTAKARGRTDLTDYDDAIKTVSSFEDVNRDMAKTISSAMTDLQKKNREAAKDKTTRIPYQVPAITKPGAGSDNPSTKNILSERAGVAGAFYISRQSRQGLSAQPALERIAAASYRTAKATEQTAANTADTGYGG